MALPWTAKRFNARSWAVRLSGMGGGGPVMEAGSPVERVMWGMERARSSSWVVLVGEEDMIVKLGRGSIEIYIR